MQNTLKYCHSLNSFRLQCVIITLDYPGSCPFKHWSYCMKLSLPLLIRKSYLKQKETQVL